MRRLHYNQKSLIEYSVRTKWGTRSLTHEPFGEPYPYHPGRVRTGWHTNSDCWNRIVCEGMSDSHNQRVNIMLMCGARIRRDTRLCTLRCEYFSHWSWGDRSNTTGSRPYVSAELPSIVWSMQCTQHTSTTKIDQSVWCMDAALLFHSLSYMNTYTTRCNNMCNCTLLHSQIVCHSFCYDGRHLRSPGTDEYYAHTISGSWIYAMARIAPTSS